MIARLFVPFLSFVFLSWRLESKYSYNFLALWPDVFLYDRIHSLVVNVQDRVFPLI